MSRPFARRHTHSHSHDAHGAHEHPREEHGHGHDHGPHGHTHGTIDASISATDRGLWAVRWSFVGLLVTALIQIVIFYFSNSTLKFLSNATIHVDPANASGEKHHRIEAHAHDGGPEHSHP